MGIYFQKYKPILELNRTVNGQEENLDEEEQNETPANQNDEHADDDTEATDYNSELEGEDTEEDNNFEEPNEEENTEETNEEDEHADDDTEATDYNSELDSEGEEETSEEGEEDTEEDSEEDESDSGDEMTDEVKEMEKELFKSVPEDQMAIKVTELKKQYLDVYNTISNILLRTNKITKTNDNMKVLEFIVNKLMVNTFDTKSFIENTVNYQQYLATLNTINKIFIEIKDKKEDK